MQALSLLDRRVGRKLPLSLGESSFQGGKTGFFEKRRARLGGLGDHESTGLRECRVRRGRYSARFQC